MLNGNQLGAGKHRESERNREKESESKACGWQFRQLIKSEWNTVGYEVFLGSLLNRHGAVES